MAGIGSTMMWENLCMFVWQLEMKSVVEKSDQGSVELSGGCVELGGCAAKPSGNKPNSSDSRTESGGSNV